MMRTFLFLLLAAISAPSLAQPALPTRYISFGLSANNYRGDLEDGIAQYKPGLHLGLQLNRAKRLNGSFTLSVGQVEGQDPDFSPQTAPEVQANRYFSTTYIAANYMLHYNLLKKERYVLYIGQGIGLFRYKPTDDQGQALQDQRSTRLAEEEYGNISLMLPTAVGGMYHLPNHWSIGLQAAYLNTLTDYLDNISELGGNAGADNVLQFRLQVWVPLQNSVPAKQ